MRERMWIASVVAVLLLTAGLLTGVAGGETPTDRTAQNGDSEQLQNRSAATQSSTDDGPARIPPAREEADVVVDPDGSGDVRTIQAGVNNASSGDTVYVANESYGEQVVVNESVTLVGRGATMDGSAASSDDYAFAVERSATIEGFLIENYRNGVVGQASDGQITISGMYFSGTRYGINASGSRSSWRLSHISARGSNFVVESPAESAAREHVEYDIESVVYASGSEGDFTVADATFTRVQHGIVAQRSSADWLLRDVEDAGGGPMVTANNATGNWQLRSVESTSTDGIEARDSSGEWDVLLADSIGGIDARDSVGNWTITGDGGIGILVAPDTSGDWNISTAGNVTSIVAKRSAGNWTVGIGGDTGYIEAANSTGDWFVSAVETQFSAGIEATGAAGNWTVLNVTSTDHSAIEAEDTAGDWVVAAASSTDAVGVDAENATGDWDITRVTSGSETAITGRNSTGNWTVGYAGSEDGDGIVADQSAGDWNVSRVRYDWSYGVSAKNSTGDWAVSDISGDGTTSIVATGTAGNWRVSNLTGGSYGIKAAGSTGDWTVTGLTGVEIIGIRAGESAGDWAVSNLSIEKGSFGINANSAAGDWTITNLSVNSTGATGFPGYGIEARDASGNWSVSSAEVRTGGRAASIYAEDTTGRWVVRDATFYGGGIGIDAIRSAADWRLVRLDITNQTIGVRSINTSGTWALSNLRIRNTSDSIEATNASSDWTISDLRGSGNAYSVISARGSTGPWTVRNMTTTTAEDSILAEESEGDWDISDLNSTEGQISAQVSSGNWSINYTEIGASGGIDAHGALGNWWINRTEIREGADIDVEDTAGNWWIYRTEIRTGNRLRAEDTEGNWTIRSTVFELPGIHISGSSRWTIHSSNFLNPYYSILTDDYSGNVNATRNWWQNAAGPGGYDIGSNVNASLQCFKPCLDGDRGIVPAGNVSWKYRKANTIDKSMTVAGGLLYAGSDTGTLYAIDAETGRVEWSNDTGSTIQTAPLVANGTVYIGTGSGTVHAFDSRTGRKRWKFTVSGSVRASPAWEDGTVYVGSTDGTLYALDAETGQKQWVRRVSNSIIAPPASHNGTVYAGSKDGWLFAFESTTGRTLWSYYVDGNVTGAPTVASGTVYVVGRDVFGRGTIDRHRLVALDTRTGQREWSSNLSAYSSSSPTVANGTLYVGSDGVLALNATSGETVWEFTGEPTAPGYWDGPTVAGGTVYVGLQDGDIWALHATTGRALWETDISVNESYLWKRPDETVTAPTVADGTLFVGAAERMDGDIVAIDTRHDNSSSGSRARLGTLGHVGDLGGGGRSGQRINSTPTAKLKPIASCVQVGDTVQFDASASNVSSGSISSYRWSVAGRTLTTTRPTVGQTFSTAGPKQIRVTVTTDSGTTDTTTRTVRIRSAGNGNGGVKLGTSTPTVGDSVRLSACGNGFDSVRWSFGDGMSATGTDVTHSWGQSGNYTVTLQTTAGGTTTATNRAVTVSNSSLTVDAISSDGPRYLFAGLPITVNYTARVSGADTAPERVEFSVDGRTTVDRDGSDGWTTSVDVANLSGPTQLTVTAVASDGSRARKQVRVMAITPPSEIASLIRFCTLPSVNCGLNGAKYKTVFDAPELSRGPVGVSAQAGYEISLMKLRLSVFGGGTVGAQTGRLSPVEINGNGTLNLRGSARYDYATNTVKTGGINASGKGVVEGKGDIRLTPLNVPGVAGLYVSIQPKVEAAGKAQLSKSLVPSPNAIEPEAKELKLTGAVGVLPLWVKFGPCESGAGAEFGVDYLRDYQSGDASSTGSVAAIAKGSCPWRTIEKKATITTVNFTGYLPSSARASVRTAPSTDYLVGSPSDSTTRVRRLAVVNRSSNVSKFPDKYGRGPRVSADVASSPASPNGPPSLGTASTRSTRSTRLTADDLDDESPALVGTDAGYTLVWERQDEEKNISDGRDIFTSTYRSGTWSEPRHLTDDRYMQTDPDIAGGTDGTVAIWGRIDETVSPEAIENSTAAELYGDYETVIGTRDDAGWEIQQLTSDDVMDTEQQVAHSDGRWLLSWVRDSDGDVTTADRTVVYQVYDGESLGQRRTVAAESITISGADGSFRLAYPDNGTVTVERVGFDGTRTVMRSYTANTSGLTRAEVTDVSVTENRTAWLVKSPNGTRLQVATSSRVKTLSLRDDAASVRELRLHTTGTDGRVLLTYRGRLLGETGTRLFYRVYDDGNWVRDHTFASGGPADLTVWQMSTAVGPDGFVSAHVAQPPASVEIGTTPPRADILATNHTFRPDYELTATAPDSTAIGQPVVVNYTVHNVGDVSTKAPTTLAVSNGSEQLTTVTVDPLTVGAEHSGTVSVPAPSSGRLTLSVDPTDDVAELNESNNQQTLTTGRANLSIAALSHDRNGSSFEVTATIANTGPVPARNLTVRLDDGGATTRTEAVARITTGQRRSIDFTVPVTQVDRSELSSVTVDTDRERDDTDAVRFRALQPDIRLAAGSTRAVAAADGVRLAVPVANVGPGPATTTIRATDGNETLATTTVDIEAAVDGTQQFETARLLVNESVVGESIVISARSDVPDADPTDNGFRTTVDTVAERPLNPPELENTTVSVTDSQLTVATTAVDAESAVTDVSVTFPTDELGSKELQPMDGQHRYRLTVPLDGAGSVLDGQSLTLSATDTSGNVGTTSVTVDVGATDGSGDAGSDSGSSGDDNSDTAGGGSGDGSDTAGGSDGEGNDGSDTAGGSTNDRGDTAGGTEDGAGESENTGTGDAGGGATDDDTERVRIDNSSVVNETVRPGESITVTVAVTNDRATRTTVPVVARSDDGTSVRRALSVDRNTTTRTEATLQIDTPGTYEVAVANTTVDTVTVSAAQPETPTGETDTGGALPPDVESATASSVQSPSPTGTSATATATETNGNGGLGPFVPALSIVALVAFVGVLWYRSV